ncbi:DUF4240 domain-containing protein [Streptomyces atratus]
MDENTCWQLIDDCRPARPDDNGEQLAERLTARLFAGPLPAVVGFAEQLSWALHRPDRREYGRARRIASRSRSVVLARRYGAERSGGFPTPPYTRRPKKTLGSRRPGLAARVPAPGSRNSGIGRGPWRVPTKE